MTRPPATLERFFACLSDCESMFKELAEECEFMSISDVRSLDGDYSHLKPCDGLHEVHEPRTLRRLLSYLEHLSTDGGKYEEDDGGVYYRVDRTVGSDGDERVTLHVGEKPYGMDVPAFTANVEAETQDSPMSATRTVPTVEVGTQVRAETKAQTMSTGVGTTTLTSDMATQMDSQVQPASTSSKVTQMNAQSVFTSGMATQMEVPSVSTRNMATQKNAVQPFTSDMATQKSTVQVLTSDTATQTAVAMPLIHTARKHTKTQQDHEETMAANGDNIDDGDVLQIAADVIILSSDGHENGTSHDRMDVHKEDAPEMPDEKRFWAHYCEDKSRYPLPCRFCGITKHYIRGGYSKEGSIKAKCTTCQRSQLLPDFMAAIRQRFGPVPGTVAPSTTVPLVATAPKPVGTDLESRWAAYKEDRSVYACSSCDRRSTYWRDGKDRDGVPMAKCTNCKTRIPVTTLLNTVFGKVGTEGKVAMSRDTLPPGAAIYSESPQVQLSSVLHAELSYFFSRYVDTNGLQTLVKRLDKDEPPICKVVHSVAMSPEKKLQSAKLFERMDEFVRKESRARLLEAFRLGEMINTVAPFNEPGNTELLNTLVREEQALDKQWAMLSADERKLRIRAMTTTAKARLQWYDRVYRLCCQLAGNSYVVDSDDEENRDARRLAVAFTQLDSVWSLACVLRSEEIAEVESAMDGLRLA